MWSIARTAGNLGRRPKAILLLACLALLPTREASSRDIVEEFAASQNLEVAHQEATRAYQRASLAIDWYYGEEEIDRLERQLALGSLEPDEAHQRQLELSFKYSELDAVREKAYALGVRPPDDDSYQAWERKLDAYAEKSRRAIRNLQISFGANLKSAANQVGACRLDAARKSIAALEQVRDGQLARQIAQGQNDLLRKDDRQWLERVKADYRDLASRMDMAQKLHDKARAAARRAVTAERAGNLHVARERFKAAEHDWQEAREALMWTGCTKELAKIDLALRKVRTALARVDKRIGSGILPPVPPGGCRQVCEPEQRCEVREACEWKVDALDGRMSLCTGGNWDANLCQRRLDCDKTEKVCETVENCHTVCD
jgi:hypothetical protein